MLPPRPCSQPRGPGERQGQPLRRGQRVVQTGQPAQHQRGERGDNAALGRQDRGGVVPGELAL